MGWGCVAQWAWAGKRAKYTASQIFNFWEWSGVKRKRVQTIQQRLQIFGSDVERTVSRSHITNPYQKNIYQSPNAQASKAEQFAQTLSPLAQIKPICPKTTECNATERHEGKHTWNKMTQKMLSQHTSWVKTCLSIVSSCKAGHNSWDTSGRFTWVLMLLTICNHQSSYKISVSEIVFYLQKKETFSGLTVGS